MHYTYLTNLELWLRAGFDFATFCTQVQVTEPYHCAPLAISSVGMKESVIEG